MQSVLLLAAATVALALACKTPWQDCGSTHVKINNVVVENCCSSPCKVQRGKSTEFSFTFTPDQGYQDLNQSVCGEISPTVCVQFPNETFTDMCHCKSCSLSPSCPFDAGKTYNMSTKIPIASAFPPIKTVAKWTITDPKDTSTPIGCFQVVVQVVD